MKRSNNSQQIRDGVIIMLLAMILSICSESILLGQTRMNQDNSNQILVSVSQKEAARLEKKYVLSEQAQQTVIKRRFVKLDTISLIKKVIEPMLKEGKTDDIKIPLFDDLTVIITTEKVEKISSTRYNWIGHIQENEFERAIFVFKDNKLTGNVRYKQKLYQIRPVNGQNHTITEIIPSRFPNETDPKTPGEREDPSPVDEKPMDEHNLPEKFERKPMAEEADSIAKIEPAESLIPAIVQYKRRATLDKLHISHVDWYKDFFHVCGPIIDVMVVYTNDAASATGDIEADIALAITETNDTYKNSGIHQRLRLVHTEEVSYTESGDFETDLDRLKTPSDGFLDNVHSLRYEHAADIVSLWVDSGEFCGIAYVMTNVNTAFFSSGFCVVRRDCATGNLSFAHELGHIMGARHDRFDDDTDGSPYDFNHGYVNFPDRWRTIMAYNEDCDCRDEVTPCPDLDSRATQWDPYCDRLPYWSNPNKSYGGEPMGIADGQANAADNRKTLNSTASTVASFRTTTREAGGQGWGSAYFATHIAFGDVDNDGRDEVGVTRYAAGNARWWILDDALTGFAPLKSGGGNWGSANWATSIEFGNVDNDPQLEVGLTRKAGGNARWWIFDDASTGFSVLKTGGSNWGESNFATDIAFGDVDNDGRDEIGLTRKAGGNARWWIFDDATTGFSVLKSGGSGWGSKNYATAIAFGNVDDDPQLEVGLTRKAGGNARWWILDDKNAGFATLKSGGNGWGEKNYATDIAFGDVDYDGKDEVGFTRKAGGNARWWILDDANAGFATLRSGGNNWGSGNYATSIAFGDVDRDGYSEVAFTRKTTVNDRYWVLDDAKCGFRTIYKGGYSWGSQNYGTSVAFGDVDGSKGAEIGITRKAGGNARFWVIDLYY